MDAVANTEVINGSAAAIASACRTIETEAQGLASLRSKLNGPLGNEFAHAIEILKSTRGRVIVTGIGKSGHIGQKITATFASTGTPAHFVHPSEASHGDLGMITREDCILAMSWSGETVELSNILNFAGRFAVPLIAITSRRDSALGRAANVVLELPREAEACPHGLAPTTSTAMQLAIGDCLAVALLEAKGFTAHDFKVFHPGGSLGAKLKFVADVMHTEERLPLAGESDMMAQAIVTMTAKALGCIGIVNADGRFVGIITDGDLRRHMGKDLLSMTTAQIMTRKPKTIAPNVLASAALEQINASRINVIFVVDKEQPIGVLHVHDLLRLGLG